MRPRHWHIALMAGSGWLAIVATIALPGLGFALIALSVASVLGRGLLPGLRSIPWRWFLLALPLSVLVGGTLIHSALRSPHELVDIAGAPATVVVVTGQTLTASSRYVAADIRSVNSRGLHPVSAMVFLDPPLERLPPGTHLEIDGRILQAERYNPKAWSVFADSVTVVREAPWLFAKADSLRAQFLERSLANGGDGGALLPGLSLGDTEGVNPGLESSMRQSALAHLVAVSGANVALVVGLVVGLATLLGAGLWWRLGLGITTLALFMVLVTPEPSVIRASAMASIALLAMALGRPQSGLVAVSLAAGVLLLSDPWRSLDIAFVLSVAATVGIILGLLPAARTLERVLPKPLALVVALPLVAQLAVQPFIILLRPTIPIYGVIANLLAGPLVPLVTISGLLGALLGPVAPGLADLMARLGWYPASAIAAIAHATTRLPSTEIAWMPGVIGAALAAVVSAGGFILLSGKAPRVGALVATVPLVVSLGVSYGPIVKSSLSLPKHWQIIQCDVGQGDALLVNTERGVVGIDTGNDEQGLRACLQVAGVSRISHLLLTHFDIDHVGQSAIYRGRTQMVLTGPTDNNDDIERLEALEQDGAKIHRVHEGEVLDLGDYFLHILWPSTQELGEAGNDSSVVALFQPRTPGEAPSLLALGDLSEGPQRMLASRLPTRDVDVVKVSHHGSADQSEQLYHAVSAPIALIGVGAENDYGHPSEQALSFLQHSGASTFRSDRHGIVAVWREDGALKVWSEKAG